MHTGWFEQNEEPIGPCNCQSRGLSSSRHIGAQATPSRLELSHFLFSATLSVGISLGKVQFSWQQTSSSLIFSKLQSSREEMCLSWSCHKKLSFISLIWVMCPPLNWGKNWEHWTYPNDMHIDLFPRENLFGKGIRDSWQTEAMPSLLRCSSSFITNAKRVEHQENP